jgi:putative DNA primase/helicase
MRLLIDPLFETDAEEDLCGGALEKPNDCHRFARVILADTRHPDGTATFALEGDSLHRWTDMVWQPTSDASFNRDATEASKREADRLAIAARNRGLDGFATNVTVNFVSSVKNAMLTMMPQAVSQPCWLGDHNGWLANEVLACSDGLIHLPSFADGEENFRAPLTPRFFSTLNLGYPFDANGPPPALWFEFLNQVWETDPASVMLLQEWLGYLLVLDTSMQKMLILFGAGGGGKGTILEVTRHLIGPVNVTSLKLPDLAESHATQTLIGKSLCIFPDASIPQRMDKTPLVETIKSITGEDLITINPKNKPRYAAKLNTRLMVATNDLLSFDDPSGAIDRRLLVLRFTRSFQESPDKNLRRKLLKELPGILLWAIDGWKRLNEQGHFTEAASGREIRASLKEIGSPILVFVTECCEVGPTEVAGKDEIFDTWKSWCNDNGCEPGEKSAFIKLLRAAVPNVRVSRKRIDGGRLNCYTGVSLKTEVPIAEPEFDFSWAIHTAEEARAYAEEVVRLMSASLN